VRDKPVSEITKFREYGMNLSLLVKIKQKVKSHFSIMLVLNMAWVFLLMSPHYTKADSELKFETDYEGKIIKGDALVINAMKTTMYEFVADDEDIEIVENWIKTGNKNDNAFDSEVLPIIKDNCTKCHSTSSTMSDAAPEMPISNYQDLVVYLKPGLPTKLIQ
jgi:hypothetical protein